MTFLFIKSTKHVKHFNCITKSFFHFFLIRSCDEKVSIAADIAVVDHSGPPIGPTAAGASGPPPEAAAPLGTC